MSIIKRLFGESIQKMKKEDTSHDEENKITLPFSSSLDKNIHQIEQLFKECDDLIKRKFPIGENKSVWAYIAYIDSMVDRQVIEQSILEPLIIGVRQVLPKLEEVQKSLMDFIKDGGMATAEISTVQTLEDVCTAILSGDTAILLEDNAEALIISTRGWPNRGVQEPDAEGVVRGSKEGFSESLRVNTVLIRRRIRDTKLKVKQMRVGTRSKTDIAVLYLDDVVRPDILQELMQRMQDFRVDGILDSGQLEQWIEDDWKSPFPQMQVTQRPDKTASAILEGRIAIIVDNSPFVLLVPTTLNCFFQSSEDFYERWQIMSFVRIIRYGAAFLATVLPGLYIALTLYHPAMIPTNLMLSIAISRKGVPFPVIVEILIMEIAFELLREAGIRLPEPIGSTIGIVGGIIIGQAAVEANIVSPIIVIIVSLTAISSFAIPSNSLAVAFRLTKYLVILLSSIFGLYGFLLGILILLTHLSTLKSFNIPYLAPYAALPPLYQDDIKDSLLRLPSFLLTKRPIFARPDQRIRTRKAESKKKK